jgi:hypothetical protein
MGDISREMINEKTRLKKAGSWTGCLTKMTLGVLFIFQAAQCMPAGRHCTVYDLLARDQTSQGHASYL